MYQLLIPFLSCMLIPGFNKAQLPAAAFSFGGTKDTAVLCGANCITLKTKIPFIGSSASDYSVNKTNGFRPNTSPSIATNALNINDQYSSEIALPFDFPFYDITYSSLVVDANGRLSFDLANANSTTAPWSISDGLPSTAYERAVIMGVFQDINMTANTSPSRQIKIEVVGMAPYRKWVLSFYKMPLFQSACWPKIDNTYQVTLYESVGLIEVHIWERDVCMTWNNGNGIVGIQNYERDKGIMAPGRGPLAFNSPWYGNPMNEAWRFAPKQGTSLLKKIELYTAAGELVAAGDTVNDGNGNYDVSFNNVCPAATTATYLIKSTYKKFDDPSAEIYSVDTLHFSRILSITPSVQVQDACAGGSSGNITVVYPAGPAYSYALNNNAFQSSPVFDHLPPGMYDITVIDNDGGCTFGTTVQVNDVNTFVSSMHVNNTCPGTAAGVITVDGPTGPVYSYAVNNGAFQVSPVFNSLPAGAYNITVMDNAGGCVYDTIVNISEAYTTLSSVSYPRSVYCNRESGSAVPSITGASGGTFTVDIPGLDINPANGVINIRECDSGYYTISYHVNVADSCADPIAVTHVRIADYFQTIWTGEGNDDDWDNHGNWSCLRLPDSTSNVIIYSGNVVINSNVIINKLTILPGANLTISPGFNLTILNP